MILPAMGVISEVVCSFVKKQYLDIELWHIQV